MQDRLAKLEILLRQAAGRPMAVMALARQMRAAGAEVRALEIARQVLEGLVRGLRLYEV